jgi:hypothetical protein
MSDPTNLAVVDEVRFRTGRRVKVCIGGDHEIAEAVKRVYQAEGAVEAIALDLDADDAEGEAVFDPFGGGSKDALEAFFAAPGDVSAAVDALAAEPDATEPPSSAAPAPPSPPPPPKATPAPPAPAPAARAAPASPAPKPAPAAPHGRAAPAPAAALHAAASPPAPPRVAAAAAATARTAVVPLAAPVEAAPAASHAEKPVKKDKTVVSAPAPRPSAARPPAPASPPRKVELELEELTPGPGGPAPAPPSQETTGTAEFTLTDEVTGSGLLIPEEGAPPAAAGLTPREVEVLRALERLAGGAHAEPEILKPAQAMAALALLLVKKGIVGEQELLAALADS